MIKIREIGMENTQLSRGQRYKSVFFSNLAVYLLYSVQLIGTFVLTFFEVAFMSLLITAVLAVKDWFLTRF